MKMGLSASDWERIRQFAEKSPYDRDPDMLRPGVEENKPVVKGESTET